MSTDPDQIRSEIERTRDELSNDVDALAYKASPSRAVRQRTDRVRGAFRGVQDKIMGAADYTGEHASSAASAVSGAASSLGDTAAAAPTKVKQAAQGNPLAAGLIVFGAAWLVSSLLPRSEAEQQAAEQVKGSVQQHAGEVQQAASEAAHEMKDNLRAPTQQAAASVKSAASDAVQTVKEETKSATQDVKGDVQQARAEVRSG